MLGRWRQRRVETGRESQRLYGSLVVEARTLYYSRAGAVAWSLPIDSLVLIGEHTTDHGPWLADYFYVFIGGTRFNGYEAPMYANPEVLGELGPVLESTLVSGLANRTDFASRVIWPPQIADQPLLVYRPSPRGGFWGSLVDRIVPRVSSTFGLDGRRYSGHTGRRHHRTRLRPRDVRRDLHPPDGFGV